MTIENLTILLAQRVMQWGAAPDRFVTGNRGWMPRWRFQPTEKLEHALQLLDVASPRQYSIRRDAAKKVHVRVEIGVITGEASGLSMPQAISFAVARALGIEVDE